MLTGRRHNDGELRLIPLLPASEQTLPTAPPWPYGGKVFVHDKTRCGIGSRGYVLRARDAEGGEDIERRHNGSAAEDSRTGGYGLDVRAFSIVRERHIVDHASSETRVGSGSLNRRSMKVRRAANPGSFSTAKKSGRENVIRAKPGEKAHTRLGYPEDPSSKTGQGQTRLCDD